MKDKLKQEIEEYLEEVVPKLVAETYDKMQIKDIENKMRLNEGLSKQANFLSPFANCAIQHPDSFRNVCTY